MTAYKTLAGAAKEYTPKPKLQNVADLERFSVNDEVVTEERKTNEGETYVVHVLKKDGNEYRVPTSVIAQVKTILEKYPEKEYFSVVKKGTTKDDTSYQVIAE